METNLLDWTSEIAIQAGNIIKEYSERGFSRSTKSSPNDFVTEADFASEKFILSNIREKHPQDFIISEESLPHFKMRGTGYVWIVDPLDGTWNFVHGNKNCGVMLAYADPEKVLFSVLYNPFKNILVTAVRSRGVFVNKKRVRYSHTTPLSIAADNKGFQPVLEQMGMRGTCLWSSVDNAILVLSGERNMYLNNTARIWDLAPISLCFEEYGFLIKNALGKGYQWHKDRNGLVAFPADFSEEAEAIINYPFSR